MSSSTRINFHIGLPKILTDLVHSAAESRALPMTGDVRVIRPAEYRSSLRDIVNHEGDLNFVSDAAFQKLAKIKRSFHDARTIVASQHMALGSAPKVLRKVSGSLQEAQRVQNLSHLFHEYELVFHIAIRSQYNTARQLMFDPEVPDLPKRLFRQPTAWNRILSELAASCPERLFVVWDLDYSIETIKAFLTSMFDLPPDSLTAEQDSEILDLIRAENVLSRLVIPNIDIAENSLEEFEVFYEVDLDKIKAIPNVDLIRDASVLS